MVWLTVLAWISFLLWVSVLLHPYRPFLPFPDAHTAEEKAGLPSRELVSVVIPARNEEKTIEAALRSHFHSDWRPLEVVLVNDGSTDGTERIAKQCAAWEATCDFKIVQAGDLPEGWAGKVNAMRRGIDSARGSYILLTDADICFNKELTGELVAESEGRGLALNSRMALLSVSSFSERLLVPAFVYFFALLYPFRQVSNPKCSRAAAAGGCMLLRRQALKRAGGLSAIRDRIIDDVALAALIKRAGFPVLLRLTKKARSLRRYKSLGQFWRTVTRSAFTELNYSWLRLLLTSALLLIAFIVPAAALAAGLPAGHNVMFFPGAAALLLSCLLYLPTVRYYEIPVFYAFFIPFIGFLYLLMTWHSALCFVRGRRSLWKGRRYEK